MMINTRYQYEDHPDDLSCWKEYSEGIVSQLENKKLLNVDENELLSESKKLVRVIDMYEATFAESIKEDARSEKRENELDEEIYTLKKELVKYRTAITVVKSLFKKGKDD